jgi:uncharacterized Ntn-hydrolase superfamily protein
LTFSVAGRCSRTGQFGVAVASSSPAVGARCAFVRPGVGAACSQNVTDPRLGPRLLDALAAGVDGPAAVAAVVAAEPHAAWRQLSAIGAAGPAGAHSGARTLGVHGSVTGPDVVVAGNLLATSGVLPAAAAAFGAGSDGILARRLLDALGAGRDAGGEAGPLRSAALVVVADVAWPVCDLRVDWSDADPVTALDGLWARWYPEEDTYLVRALRPAQSPGYGVAGDDR